MRAQFQNLTRAALVAAWMLTPAIAHAQMSRTTDPIDGARALLGQVKAAKPTATSMWYEATAERALLARFDSPNRHESTRSAAIVERTAEHALLGR
ncbi:MAG TPA: hypothetical protein VFM14_17950 [Gemmatimonadales bacterium]|nr:hypothetical protein [Gemmatimonadales bacterium]